MQPEAFTDIVLVPSNRALVEQEIFGDNTATHGTTQVQVGTRPLATSISKSGRMPAGLRSDLLDAFDIWRVDFHCGAIAEGAPGVVKRLRFSVVFPDSPRVAVIALAPRTEFIDRAGGTISASASLSLGQATPTIESASGVDQPPVDLSISAGIGTSLRWGIHFNVLSTKVVAFGEGDTEAHWVVKNTEGTLLGTHKFVVFLAVPKFERGPLQAKARLSATISGRFGLPVPLTAEAVPLEIHLPSAARGLAPGDLGISDSDT